MECPHCKEVLLMTSRQGVEIDYCPKCRGIWLDKGELDKIIEKSNQQEGIRYSDTDYKQNYKEEHTYKDDPKYKNYPHKKRKSFLSDLFDFD